MELDVVGLLETDLHVSFCLLVSNRVGGLILWSTTENCLRKPGFVCLLQWSSTEHSINWVYRTRLILSKMGYVSLNCEVGVLSGVIKSLSSLVCWYWTWTQLAHVGSSSVIQGMCIYTPKYDPLPNESSVLLNSSQSFDPHTTSYHLLTVN